MSQPPKSPQQQSLLTTTIVSGAAFYAAHWVWPGPYGPMELKAASSFCAFVGALSGQKALRRIWDETTQFKRFWKAKSPDTVRGTAAWMDEAEARKAGLTRRGPHSRFIGVLGSTSLWADTETAHLVIGPAGSQKSTACIMNQLCNARESVLVNDVKKELYHTTGPFREAMLGHRVVLLDPTDAASECVNPLDFIHRLLAENSPEAMTLARGMVLQLYPDPPKEDQNQFFRNGTRIAMTAVVLAVCACAPLEHRTLATVLRAFTDSEFLHGLLEEAAKSTALSGAIAEAADALHAQAFGDDTKTYEQFRIGCIQALEIFAKGGVLERITAKTTFSFAEMKQAKISAYLVIDFASKDSVGKWSGLMQWLAAQELVRARNNTPVMFCLDEFCNSPLQTLPTILTLLRSYGVRVLMATQDLDDITRVYGKHALETILSESDIKQFLGGIRSQTTLEFISKALGEFTESAASYSFAKDGIGQSLARINRRLMTPDEVRRLPKAEQIVLIGNHKPVRCRKVQIFAIAPWRKQIAINSMYGTKRFLLPVELRLSRRGGRVTRKGRHRLPSASTPKGRALPVLGYLTRRLLGANGIVLLLACLLALWQLGLPHLRVSTVSNGSMITNCRYIGPTAIRPRSYDCPVILFTKPW